MRGSMIKQTYIKLCQLKTIILPIRIRIGTNNTIFGKQTDTKKSVKITEKLVENSFRLISVHTEDQIS